MRFILIIIHTCLPGLELANASYGTESLRAGHRGVTLEHFIGAVAKDVKDE